MEKDIEYMQRRMDWKKIGLLYWKRAWLIILITVLTTLIAAGCYRVVCALTKGEQLYRVSSDYYLTFNLKDHPEGVDYYNAYTWDSILRDDPIVEEALTNLPEDYTKEEIQASVTGEMLGDYRILTVYSTHENPERAQAIADAYEIGLGLFADKLDLFETIEVWSQDKCVPLEEKDLTANAAVIGALVGIVLALTFGGICNVLDDSVYIESDFTERFDITFLGMLTRNGSEFCKQELKDNFSYLLKEEKGYHLVFASMNKETEKCTESEKQDILLNKIKELCGGVDGILSLQGRDLETLRQSSGAILMIPWGSKNGNIVEKMITFMTKQNCKLVGAVLYDADDKFLKRYYNSTKSK